MVRLDQFEDAQSTIGRSIRGAASSGDLRRGAWPCAEAKKPRLSTPIQKQPGEFQNHAV
jgi:hypothetical protein